MLNEQTDLKFVNQIYTIDWLECPITEGLIVSLCNYMSISAKTCRCPSLLLHMLLHISDTPHAIAYLYYTTCSCISLPLLMLLPISATPQVATYYCYSTCNCLSLPHRWLMSDSTCRCIDFVILSTLSPYVHHCYTLNSNSHISSK